LGIPEQPGIPFDFSDPKPLPEMIKADCNEEENPDINNLSTPLEWLDEPRLDTLF
jgi:hypothetical protein